MPDDPRAPEGASSPKPYPPKSAMDPYYIGVGRISAALAHLELRISITIWELANVEQYIGACITAQFATPYPRLLALHALAEQRGASKEALSELNAIIADVRGVAGERNRFSHDPGFLSPDSDGGYLRFEVTADRKLKFGMQPNALPQMEELERKIRDLTVRFHAWRTRTLNALPPFLKTQFEQSHGISLGPPPDSSSDRTGP